MIDKDEHVSIYDQSDAFLIVNNDDTDLTPIKIRLPEQPKDKTLIDGYDLPRDEQIFRKLKQPIQLTELIRRHETGSAIWATLTSEKTKYKESIDFIKRMWFHRLYGYWFMCDGVATYIDGWHFFYLNCFPLDSGYAKYRDRDRKFFIFARFCLNDTQTFKKERFNELGEKLPNQFGDEMIDTKNRVCSGFVYPKGRREGASFKAECIMLEIMSRTMNGIGGIQSKTDKHAKEVFITKLAAPFRSLPFYFRPYTGGNQINPKAELLFELNISTTKEGSGYLNMNQGLGSKILFEVATEGAFDGTKLIFYHGDEVGKSEKIDVYKRHIIVQQCLTVDEGLVGFAIYTSTVGEMDWAGGKNFLKMCKMSNYYERDKNGQTASGLYTLFIPSSEGKKVDKFGNSLIKQGKEYIENRLTQLLSKKDVEGWDEYRRMYPTKFADCFLCGTSSVGFDIYILDKRISELILKDGITTRGDFVRASTDRNSRVSFVPNTNGRFIVSKILEDSESNLYYKNDNGVFCPNNERFSAGGDAFKFDQTEGNKMSDGAFAVLENRNYQIDPRDKPIDKWQTDLFVCTYLFRANDSEEYVDDCLKACQYYGCYILPETNVNHIVSYFTKWGYYGFLKILRNADGTWRNTPGMYTGAESKQKIFSAHRDYVKRRGAYERHIELLREIKDIPSMDKMTLFDLFTAAGFALINSANPYDPNVENGEYGLNKTDDTPPNVIKPFRFSRG